MSKLSRYNWREPPEHDRKSFIYDGDDEIQTVIGDPDKPGFTPEISLRKWDGECIIKLRLPSPPLDRIPEIDENQNIAIDYNSRRHRWFIKPDDNDNDSEAFEWEIIFPSKPFTNIIEFNIETANLEFSYQGELTQKEIDKGAHRPENVIGSYAVYHSSKANNKYKTGKVCHIYRPKIVDALNNETWCDLFIDPKESIFRLIIPQSFLDTAVYPVILDPTFGYTTVGASEVGVGSNWCYAAILAADRHTASSGDTLTELWSYVRASNGTYNFHMALYTTVGADIKLKKYETGNISAGTSMAWRKETGISYGMTAATVYCVASGEFESGGNTWWFKYDTTTAAVNENGSTFPNNWPVGSELNYRFSMYAVYTEEAGDVVITPTPASAIAAKVDPTVILGSLSITPTAISAIADNAGPTVIHGSLILTPAALSAIGAVFGPVVIEGGDILFIPDPASAIAGKADPTVILGSLTITPTAISSIGATFDPTVILGSLSITPDPISAIAGNAGPIVILGSMILTPTSIAAIGTTFGPTVIEGGDIIITPTPASALASKNDPTIILGSMIFTPEAISSIASTFGPTVILGSLTLTPAAISAVAGTSGPVVIEGSLILTPAAAAAIASGVDPSVILGSIITTPAAASAIASASGPIIIYGSLILTPSPATAVGTTTGGVLFFAIKIENLSYGNLQLENESSGGLKGNNLLNEPGLKGSNVITGSGD